MALSNEEYEKLRDRCIAAYKSLQKEMVVFDYCEVDKDVRIRLMNDPYFVKKTKALHAGLFKEQLDTIEKVLAGVYSNPEKPQDTSGTILKALEMKQKLLFIDLDANKDDSNALNVTYTAMTKEDFEALDTVTVHEGGNSAELGADFGAGDDTDSFEARMKAKTQEKLKELEASKGES